MPDKEYNVVNGTYYDSRTSNEVITVLEICRANGTRIRVEYGDVVTGRGWADEYDVTGKVSRSMGPHKIPVLIHNSRSLGGGGMLDHCIVAVMTSVGAVDLYRHPEYTPAHDWKNVVMTHSDIDDRYPFALLAPKIDEQSNDYVAYFQTEEKRANFLARKMAFNYREYNRDIEEAPALGM